MPCHPARAALTGIALLALVSGSMADTAAPALPQAPETLAIGAELHAQFCAGCHGTEARGDGPLAALLMTEVPDLTRLAADNDGVFPMLEVIHAIDGRARTAAHGGPMPLWGHVFREPAGLQTGVSGSALQASGRIMALTLWLESVQE